MIFNAVDRGVLENLFEVSIKNMKINVDVAREKMFHVVLNDKDGVDLALGMVIGTIHTSFIAGFRQRNGRKMTTEGKKCRQCGSSNVHVSQINRICMDCGLMEFNDE